MITSANITVMVTDLDRAIQFYTDTLGLTLKNRYGDHWADIEGPGIAIGLHPSDKTRSRSDNLQIGLRVDNLDTAIEVLAGKGVHCRKQDDEQVNLAFFTDPDGNTLYLVQPQW